MFVEQALFTSAQTRQARGYHLVARSPGITDELAQILSVWGPTHDSLVGPDVGFHSLNYFAASDDWGVLSRSVLGESEFSGRGGFRVETNLLLMRREQLAGYGYDPLALGRTALALGHLRLRTCSPGELTPIELPCSSLLCEPAAGRHWLADTPPSELTDRILNKLRDHRVAVIGARDPVPVVSNVLSRLTDRDRVSFSFTTGLKPSLHRKFDLQFLPTAESRSQRQLEASGIVCVDAQAC